MEGSENVQTSAGVSILHKTSYRKILHNLEGTRLVCRSFQSLWNLTGMSAAMLLRCFSNFRATGAFYILQAWDFKDLEIRRLIWYWNGHQSTLGTSSSGDCCTGAALGGDSGFSDLGAGGCLVTGVLGSFFKDVLGSLVTDAFLAGGFFDTGGSLGTAGSLTAGVSLAAFCCSDGGTTSGNFTGVFSGDSTGSLIESGGFSGIFCVAGGGSSLDTFSNTRPSCLTSQEI